MTVQAGPPYELDPYTLETKAGRPSSLDGWVPVGKAPSTTGSFVLDKVRARANVAFRVAVRDSTRAGHTERRLRTCRGEELRKCSSLTFDDSSLITSQLGNCGQIKSNIQQGN